jgi:hypothetical protein
MLRIRQLLFIFIGLFSTYSPILNGGVAFYPASGRREPTSGAFGTTGTDGRAWSSAFSGANGYYLLFYSTDVRPSYGSSRAFGFPVRCVQNLLLLMFLSMLFYFNDFYKLIVKRQAGILNKQSYFNIFIP